MKSIWVIEEGEYSDYSVVGVFSTKENAEQVLAVLSKGGWNNPTISEWPLDPAVDAIRKGYQQWIIWMLIDGTVERCESWKLSNYMLAGGMYVWERSTAPAYQGKGVKDCLNATVWAKDPKHAVKIVNEKRLQLIANGEWK